MSSEFGPGVAEREAGLVDRVEPYLLAGRSGDGHVRAARRSARPAGTPAKDARGCWNLAERDGDQDSRMQCRAGRAAAGGRAGADPVGVARAHGPDGAACRHF